MLWAELAPDGALRPARGALIVADAARQAGFRRLIVALERAREAAVFDELEGLCPLTPEARAMLAAAALDAELEHRLRQVARTIADLDPERDPSAPISAEALGLALALRPLQPLDSVERARSCV